MTNQGNKYKFKAMLNRRVSSKNYIFASSKKKNGEFGKPCKYEMFGNETAEDVIKRLSSLNNKEYKLVEA